MSKFSKPRVWDKVPQFLGYPNFRKRRLKVSMPKISSVYATVSIRYWHVTDTGLQLISVLALCRMGINCIWNFIQVNSEHFDENCLILPWREMWVTHACAAGTAWQTHLNDPFISVLTRFCGDLICCLKIFVSELQVCPIMTYPTFICASSLLLWLKRSPPNLVGYTTIITD